MTESILKVKNLRIGLREKKQVIYPVKDVSFEIKRGETYALVGESGSGKSMTALCIMGLLQSWNSYRNPVISGNIELRTKDGRLHELTRLRDQEYDRIRGNDLGIIFQEPLTALNPVTSVGRQIAEVILAHEKLSEKRAEEKALGLLKQVEIPNAEKRFHAFPHQFSGGQLQRIVIAMAIACNPTCLIADEPTTALDVTVQKQILTLLKKLQIEYGMAILMITHDLAVVSEFADKVAVMYSGQIVETGTVRQIFQKPAQPYTRMLISSIPTLDIIPGTSGEADRNTNLLEVRNLCVSFSSRSNLFSKGEKGRIQAVKQVDLSIGRNEIHGLVGESGSGKSTLGRCIMGLSPICSGTISFCSRDGEVRDLVEKKNRNLSIQMIFQDSNSSLNPNMKIKTILSEPILINRLLDKKDVPERLRELMDMVGMPEEFLERYPHQLSGGQRQRVAIARAMTTNPELIIADEPTSALDVSIQAQILKLLLDIKEKSGVSILFISHNLAVVRYISDYVSVMKTGEIVESGEAVRLFAAPQHEYTKKLWAAIPRLQTEREILEIPSRYCIDAC